MTPEEFRQLREQAGLDREQFCALVDHHINHIDLVENGHRAINRRLRLFARNLDRLRAGIEPVPPDMLQAARLCRGLTDRQMAAQLGLSLYYYRALEKGRHPATRKVCLAAALITNWNPSHYVPLGMRDRPAGTETRDRQGGGEEPISAANRTGNTAGEASAE